MPQIAGRAGLVKKEIIDRTGKKRTVWVRAQEKIKQIRQKIGEKVKEREAQKKKDYEHATTFTEKGKVFMQRKKKAMVEQIKKEIKEWKEAGSGLNNFFSGKPLKEGEGKAIATVALHTAFVVGLAALGAAGVSGGLAAKAQAFATKAALGYIEHAGILRGVAALAKAEKGSMTHEAALEKFVEGLIDYIHTNDLSGEDTDKNASEAK